MLDRLFAAVQVIINDFSVYPYFFSIDGVSLHSTHCSLSVGLNMILSYFCFLTMFVLSFIGNVEHVVAHPSVAVHVFVVRKPTHLQLYSLESLIVFCM
jgi:hypothetical protein